MSVPSHILRRIAVIALLGCAILSGLSSAAAARPIYERNLDTTSTAVSTAEPRTVSASEGGDWTPILVAGAVVLVLAGTAGYSYRMRTSRRVTA